MKPFLIRWGATTLAVFVATGLISDHLHGTVLGMAGAGLLLAVLNTVVRPLILAGNLQLVMRTFGLFYLAINAAMLKIVGWIVPGFVVDGIGGAIWGSIWISLISWGLTLWFTKGARFQVFTSFSTPSRETPNEAVLDSDANTSEMKTVKGRVIEP